MECPICRGSGKYELNEMTYDCQRCGGDGQVTHGEGEQGKKCGPWIRDRHGDLRGGVAPLSLLRRHRQGVQEIAGICTGTG